MMPTGSGAGQRPSGPFPSILRPKGVGAAPSSLVRLLSSRILGPRRLGALAHTMGEEEFEEFRAAGIVDEDVVRAAEDAILVERMKLLLLGGLWGWEEPPRSREYAFVRGRRLCANGAGTTVQHAHR